MCSYNITLNDSLVEKVRPSFADDTALTLWLQQQMEELLLNRLTQQRHDRSFLANEHTVDSALSSQFKDFEDALHHLNKYQSTFKSKESLLTKQRKTMEYTVIIHKDEKSGWYTGKCVQVPGALSQGQTLDELMENMKDAISLMLECYRDEARQAYAGEKFFYRKVALA